MKVDLRLGEAMHTRQATELAVAAYHRILRDFLHTRWQPLSVWFRHPAPADVSTHRRAFGPIVEFDREFDGIVFYAGDLDAPNAMADPLLRAYAHQYFEAITVPRDTTAADRVRELIEVLLPTGRCSIEQVARSLGVDRRTVHRHLAASGETFSSLLGATRRHLAEQFVANPRRSLTEISDLLGFSSLSGFSRWFHEQFGCSPGHGAAPGADPGSPARTDTAGRPGSAEPCHADPLGTAHAMSPNDKLSVPESQAIAVARPYLGTTAETRSAAGRKRGPLCTLPRIGRSYEGRHAPAVPGDPHPSSPGISAPRIARGDASGE